MTRVLVADDQAAVRAGFAALVAAEDDMEVAGEAATAVKRSTPHGGSSLMSF
jgi:DNA-binding NarL/FixJ family response regulator